MNVIQLEEEETSGNFLGERAGMFSLFEESMIFLLSLFES